VGPRELSLGAADPRPCRHLRVPIIGQERRVPGHAALLL